MVERNYDIFNPERLFGSDTTRILARTQRYDHCNMTCRPFASPPLIGRLRQLLFGMSYDDPRYNGCLISKDLRSGSPGALNLGGPAHRDPDTIFTSIHSRIRPPLFQDRGCRGASEDCRGCVCAESISTEGTSPAECTSHRAEGSRPTSSQWMTRRECNSVICASL
jgi:hypothetical protein